MDVISYFRALAAAILYSFFFLLIFKKNFIKNIKKSLTADDLYLNEGLK
jgi:hypothetical protein